MVKDKLKRQEVETGVMSLTRIEVTKGVSDGSQIALGAVTGQALKNGMEVRVIQR